MTWRGKSRARQGDAKNRHNYPMIRILAVKLVAFCAVVSSGCGTTVPAMNMEFPTPLIENLPISIGVYYDDDLRNFTYNETVSDGSSWTIELGQNNTRLFDRLFGAMFSRTTRVDDIENGPDDIQAIIQPILEEYAFLTPNELGSRFYAVSIRYRLILYDTAGTELADWPINAYGQSRSGIFNAGRGKTGPLQNATDLAMRDAAAGAIVSLPTQPEILALINGEQINAESNDNQ